MPQITAGQRTPEWEQARLDHVSASIAAACLGLNPNCSRQKAWRIACGREVEKMNGHMERGVEREPEARRQYEAETGLLIQETGLWRHPEHPWLLASPDGLVGDDGCVEIKCPLVLHNSVSEQHRIQCMIVMAVTGRAWCDFYSYIDPWNTYRERIPMLPRLTKTWIAELEKFYQDYIVKDQIPERKKRSPKVKS